MRWGKMKEKGKKKKDKKTYRKNVVVNYNDGSTAT